MCLELKPSLKTNIFSPPFYFILVQNLYYLSCTQHLHTLLLTAPSGTGHRVHTLGTFTKQETRTLKMMATMTWVLVHCTLASKYVHMRIAQKKNIYSPKAIISYTVQVQFQNEGYHIQLCPKLYVIIH